MSFKTYIIKNHYNKKIQGLGDRLCLMKNQINWTPFVQLIRKVFYDNEKTGGRPHTDEIIIIKTLLLQSWYGLSDPETEFMINDRISFQNFLDYPEKVPDFSTIWRIRERLQKRGTDKQIWKELQRQLNKKGYKVSNGKIQDATFIEADLGKKRHHKEKKAKKEGKQIVYTKKQSQHIDKDGSFSVKLGQVYYGYKSHIKMDMTNHLIEDFDVTTASQHDGKVDLSNKDEIIYRDRGYTGVKSKAKGNASMKRGKLSYHEIHRNQRISKKRVIGERPFAVIKNVFNGTRTRVKNLQRVKIKEMFKCFAYNLYNLVTLERKRLAVAL